MRGTSSTHVPESTGDSAVARLISSKLLQAECSCQRESSAGGCSRSCRGCFHRPTTGPVKERKVPPPADSSSLPPSGLSPFASVDFLPHLTLSSPHTQTTPLPPPLLDQTYHHRPVPLLLPGGSSSVSEQRESSDTSIHRDAQRTVHLGTCTSEKPSGQERGHQQTGRHTTSSPPNTYLHLSTVPASSH